MNKMKVTFWLALIVLTATTIRAQDASTLLARIDRSISTQQHPGWKLRTKKVYPSAEQGLYDWIQGGSVVIVHLFVRPSPEEASLTFKALPDTFRSGGSDSGGFEMTVLRAKVPGLGDENFLWEGFYAQKIFGVDYRKGKVVVHTQASSIAVAEQFALQTAEAIPGP